MVGRVVVPFTPKGKQKQKQKWSGKTPFVKGHTKSGGRPPGIPNKTTRILKEAILLAAELEGNDTKGKDELIGYLRMVARTEIPSFCTLLGRVLPLQVNVRASVTQSIITDKMSAKEAADAYFDSLKAVDDV
jgi:hypothetical protein